MIRVAYGGKGAKGDPGDPGSPGSPGSPGQNFPNNVVTKTGAYNAVSGDVVLCDASSATFQVTLPAAAANLAIAIKKVDSTANPITVAATGGKLIDGAASVSVTSQYQSRDFVCDGTNWWVI